MKTKIINFFKKLPSGLRMLFIIPAGLLGAYVGAKTSETVQMYFIYTVMVIFVGVVCYAIYQLNKYN